MAFPGKPVARLVGSNGPVNSLAYSASPGTYILTGSSDRAVRLYNPQPDTSDAAPGPPSRRSSGDGENDLSRQPGAPDPLPEGRLIQTYAAHGYEVLSLSVAADNARFASAGGDRTVFLWDVAATQPVRRFGGGGGGTSQGGHSSRVNSVTFAGADDGLLVSGGFDRTVRVWDVRSRAARPVQTLAEARDGVSAVAVCGAAVVAGSVDGRVRTYDVRAGRCVTDVVGPSVTSLCLARDGKAMLVGALDSKIRLMDRETGGCLKTYADPAWTNQEFRVQSLLGGKEQYVVAGDEMADTPAQDGEGRIWAWDVLTGDLKAKISVPWGPIGPGPRKKVVGKDGKEKPRTNVISCLAWRDVGFGDQFCVSGTSGVTTVFGYP